MKIQLGLPLEDPQGTVTGVRCVTLWQPWASLMFMLNAKSERTQVVKQNETRPFGAVWARQFKGELFIHAAKRKIDSDGWEVVQELFFEGYLSCMPTRDSFPLGCILGKVYFTQPIVMTEDLIAKQTEPEIITGDWRPGRIALIGGDRKKLIEPIECKGSQGLWSAVGIEEELKWEVDRL